MSEQTLKNGKRGVVILSHGSRRKEANDTLGEVSAMLEARSGEPVSFAFMTSSPPSLPEALSSMVNRGLTELIVLPLFLFPGIHWTEDIPQLVKDARRRWPEARIRLAEVVGGDGRLVDILLSRLEAVLGAGRNHDDHQLLTEPAGIEQESDRQIERALSTLALDFQAGDEGKHQLEVVRRIAKATGDPGLASQVVFAPDAVGAAVAALRQGESVVCDVKMVAAGITSNSLGLLGGDVCCRLDAPGVQEEALAKKVTRTSIGIRKALLSRPRALVAIGNAPTALNTVGQLIREDRARPSAIVGVPVGFVGAAAVKEKLTRWGVPYITVPGRRGGSPVAAAVINAVIAIARRQEEVGDKS